MAANVSQAAQGALEAYVRIRPINDIYIPRTTTLHDDRKNVTVRLASARSGPLGMGRSFSFDRTFGEETSQAQIFEAVAAPLCDAALDGFNATVFAYGQTGSGKTFTMHGGATTGDARGLMVRAVEHLLAGMVARPQSSFSLCASYMQLVRPTSSSLPTYAAHPFRTHSPRAPSLAIVQ